jgi:hypothetical protein
MPGDDGVGAGSVERGVADAVLGAGAGVSVELTTPGAEAVAVGEAELAAVKLPEELQPATADDARSAIAASAILPII